MQEKRPEPLQVDARKLLCPMPVIRTQQAIEELDSGARVELLATDPGVLHDIPAWCRVHGHTVLATERDAADIRILIEVVK